jgi:DNA-binding NarL/FixJ family response regulator
MQLAPLAPSRCVRVAVQAPDPISQAGIASYLDSRPEVVVLPPHQRTAADVLVLAPERLSTAVLSAMRRSARENGQPTVLIANDINESDLLIAVECHVMAVLPRAAATSERLLSSVLAAASGAGMLPPDLVGELLKHVQRLQREVLEPRGLNTSGLNPREIDVLRLMSEGLDTIEIAAELCYSERTVKNIIYGLTTRLKLRNRPHAVAYAMRTGMI